MLYATHWPGIIHIFAKKFHEDIPDETKLEKKTDQKNVLLKLRKSGATMFVCGILLNTLRYRLLNDKHDKYTATIF